MATLHVTRGLPGSGKSTYAKGWVAADCRHRVRVNRDDARDQHHGGYVNKETEKLVTVSTHASIRALLQRGIDVICDDTNLNPDTLEGLRRLARYAGAGFEIHDFTHVPVDECVARDKARPEPVGEAAIRGMWARHLDPEAKAA